MRKTITVSISHELPPQDVKQRIVKGIADARARHGDLLKGAQENWTTENRMDFTARAMGQTIMGQVQIEPQMVHLTLELPVALALLAGKIKPRIESEARRLLEKKE